MKALAHANADGVSPSTRFDALQQLVGLMARQGDLEAAYAYQAEALALPPSAADPWHRFDALWDSGLISANAGDFDRAAGYVAEAQSIADMLDLVEFKAECDALRGYIAYEAGRFDDAIGHLTRVASAIRDLQSPAPSFASTFITLGVMHAIQGDVAAARAALEASLGGLDLEPNVQWETADAWAWYAFRAGNPVLAASLIRSGAQVRLAHGVTVEHGREGRDRLDLEDRLGAVLGADDFADADARAQSKDLRSLISEAVDLEAPRGNDGSARGT